MDRVLTYRAPSPPIRSMDRGYVHSYNGPVGGANVPSGSLDTIAPTTQQGWRELIGQNPTLGQLYRRF